MDQIKQPEKMDRSISFFGLIALGIGCMFGTSWLLLSAGWLDRAGGPWNVVLALILCLIVELPLAFAYLDGGMGRNTHERNYILLGNHFRYENRNLPFPPA